MEAMKIKYEGHNYLVIPISHDPFYGRKDVDVYHVLTDNQKWCGPIIAKLCGFPNVEPKGLHDLNYKRQPTILNALKPYYTLEYKEDDMYERHFDMKAALYGFNVDMDSYYEFVYKEPYDD